MTRGGDAYGFVPLTDEEGEQHAKINAAKSGTERIEKQFEEKIAALMSNKKTPMTRKQAEDQVYKEFVGHKLAKLTGHSSSFGGSRKKHRKLYKMKGTRKLRGGLDAMQFRKLENKERGVNAVGTDHESAEDRAYKKFVEQRMKEELAAREKEKKRVVPGAVPLLGQKGPLTVKGARRHRRRHTRRRRLLRGGGLKEDAKQALKDQGIISSADLDDKAVEKVITDLWNKGGSYSTLAFTRNGITFDLVLIGAHNYKYSATATVDGKKEEYMITKYLSDY